MNKKEIISDIKQRIKDEQRKHKNLDWYEIAARKIYSAHISEYKPINESKNKEQEIDHLSKQIKNAILSTLVIEYEQNINLAVSKIMDLIYK